MRSTAQLRALVAPRKAVKRRNPERFSKNWTRAHHSVERVEFVNAMPCLTCTFLDEQQSTPTQNAHGVTGGKGRKAGYETIFPACDKHHKAYDRHKPPFDERAARETMKACAKLVEEMWADHMIYHGDPTAKPPLGVIHASAAGIVIQEVES